MRIGLRPSAAWYAFVGSILGAFIAVSLQNRSESEIASVEINWPSLKLATNESTPTTEQNETPDLEIGSLHVSISSRSEHQKRELTIGRGDTLLGLLRENGVTSNEAHAAVAALKKTYDPRDIRVGQEITVSTNTGSSAPTLDAVRIAVGPGHDVLVLNTGNGDFKSDVLKATTVARTNAYSGTITTSLYEAAIEQGVPAQTLVEMIRLFSYDVDFQRDIRRNDKFELMFTQNVTDEGLVVSNDDVTYAAMTLRGQTYKIYAYEHADGRLDHYNEEGKGIRKALMRTPINGARLSSSFGRRKHPVLGYTKMHRGVDFAAPAGTPIYAAGDGVIEKRHRWGSFGNYIRIRHGDGFSTAYAHMKGFARGQSVGSRVRQGAVIGYVGTTGRSTGPHLHYEVHRNGSQVNPMKVRFPASKSLNGTELAAFKQVREKADQSWAELVSTRDIAQLSNGVQQSSVE